MGDDDGNPVGLVPFEHARKRSPAFGVEGRTRLVQKKHLRTLEHGSHDGNLLLLPTRKSGMRVVQDKLRSVGVSKDLLKAHVFRKRNHARLLYVSAAQQGEILPQGAGDNRGMLAYKANGALTQLVLIKVPQLLASDNDLSIHRTAKLPCHRAQQRCLT